MANTKKTFNVDDFIEWGNKNLARTDKDADFGFKDGICSSIEHVLHATGNYKGFMYLNLDDKETGTVGGMSRMYFYSNWYANKTSQS